MSQVCLWLGSSEPLLSSHTKTNHYESANDLIGLIQIFSIGQKNLHQWKISFNKELAVCSTGEKVFLEEQTTMGKLHESSLPEVIRSVLMCSGADRDTWEKISPAHNRYVLFILNLFMNIFPFNKTRLFVISSLIANNRNECNNLEYPFSLNICSIIQSFLNCLAAVDEQDVWRFLLLKNYILNLFGTQCR